MNGIEKELKHKILNSTKIKVKSRGRKFIYLKNSIKREWAGQLAIFI